MSKIVDGRKLAQDIAEQLKIEIDELKQKGIQPKLVILAIRPDKRSSVYIRMKLKRAEEIGMTANYIELEGDDHKQCTDKILELNKDNTVHGIVVQLPLTGWYDPQELIDFIDPTKDVDGLTSTNQIALEENKAGLKPATPLAAMEILNQNQIDLQNKSVCVIGRSHLVGMPLRYMLEHAGAQVLVGHRSTTNLTSLTKQADILISAAGSPGLVNSSMVKKDAVVIDVGINDVSGKLKGDVDFESVKEVASIITPVPGGVGPLTVVMLLKNVLTVAKNK